MNNNIDTLISLNKSIQDLDLNTIAEHTPNKVDFILQDGTAMLFNLMNKKGVAVADGFISKDTILPFHAHVESKQFLIVYKGCLTMLREDGVRVEIEEGNMCIVNSNTIHSVHAKKDTFYITVTIPSDPSFPKM